MTRSITDELRRLPPGLHGEGNEFWGLAWPALRWLEREVRAEMRTAETGAGSSTLVFAAAGCAGPSAASAPHYQVVSRWA